MILKKVFLFVLFFATHQIISQNYTVKNKSDFGKAIAYFHQFKDSIIATKKDVYNEPLVYSKIKWYETVLKWANKNATEEEIFEIKRIIVELYIFININRFSEEIPKILSLIKDLLTYEKVYETADVVEYLQLLKFIYEHQKNYEEFLKTSLIHQKYGKKFEYFEGRNSPYYGDIAKAHYQLGNYEKAIEAWKIGIKEYSEVNNYSGASSFYNNVGLSFYKIKKLDSAKYYYNLAVKTIEVNNLDDNDYQNHFKNVINGNIGKILVDQGNIDEGLILFQKELKTAKEQDEEHIITSAYYKIASVLNLKNKIALSQKYLDSTFIAAKIFSEITTYEKSLLLRAKNYLLERKLDKSNTYFNLHRSFLDSINSLKAKEDFMNSIVKYETTIKTNELKTTKNTLSLQEKKNNLQQLFLIIALFTAIILILFFMRIRKSNLIISKQKNDLEKSLDEKNVLLKEIHHRVKNNLQMVMSILEIQNSTLSNKKLKGILSESQNRIQSIALVHEQLYNNNALNNLELKNYIEQLIQQIIIIATPKNKKIDYKINIENIYFSTDLTLILGIIINELISNIYKYAFLSKDEGFYSVDIKKTQNGYFLLEVYDNGIGVDHKIDLNNINSLGLRIVNLMVNQLKGDIKISNLNGTKFSIKFNPKA